MKKVVIFIIAILCIIGIIIFMKPSKEKMLETVNELTQKAIATDNVSIECTQNGQKTTVMIKGTKSIFKKGNNIIWTDSANKEQITVMLDKKTAVIMNPISAVSQMNYTMDSILKNNSTGKIEYQKTENYNGKKCYLLEYTNTISQNYTTKRIYYVDAKTGFVLKKESDTSSTNEEYTISVNCVKDSDVAKPNLTGYTITNKK